MDSFGSASGPLGLCSSILAFTEMNEIRKKCFWLLTDKFLQGNTQNGFSLAVLKSTLVRETNILPFEAQFTVTSIFVLKETWCSPPINVKV